LTTPAYRLDRHRALVQKLIFYADRGRPVFMARSRRRILLSDIFAMGADPLTALNIVGFCRFSTKSDRLDFARRASQGIGGALDA
jgi:hypothetical protein